MEKRSITVKASLGGYWGVKVTRRKNEYKLCVGGLRNALRVTDLPHTFKLTLSRDETAGSKVVFIRLDSEGRGAHYGFDEDNINLNMLMEIAGLLKNTVGLETDVAHKFYLSMKPV